MIKEFISKDQNFSTRTDNTYLKIIFLVPVCCLILAALGYSIAHHEGSSRVTRAGRILEGLSYMDITSVVISLLGAIVILIGLLVFLKSYYKNREIIVALRFDEDLKDLTITTKRIDGQEFTRTHKYSDLLLEYNHLSDGMTSPMYNTYTLVSGDYLAGHLYMAHFTWDDTILSEIKRKLKSCIKDKTDHSKY